MSEEQGGAVKIKALKPDELSAFCYKFSLMMKAGINSSECISILLEETDYPREHDILNKMYEYLDMGEPLSAALRKTGCFPLHLINMVTIGEQSGRLEQVMTSMAHYYQQEADLSYNIKRAITSPALMIVMMAVVFMVLMVKVLPVFKQVFEQLGTGLSPLTESMLRLGSVSETAALIFTALLVVLVAALLLLLRSENGSEILRRGFDKLFFRGDMGLALSRSRFASAMNMMMESGMNLDQAVVHAEELLKGSLLTPRLGKCIAAMEAGTPFPAAVAECEVLSSMQAGMLSAAFRAGAAEESLANLAVRCQEEADDMMAVMLGRIEPTLILILSLAVGLVLLSVMLPLIGVMSSIGT
ncbi:MAG: type II secretion system F family protein [Syntrophomonadaceae bacterium]|nr:type II secretion system F family protein [Syntrophomonadaceae bacterium]